MANLLKMAIVHAIIGLLEQNWSYRRIARELGVDRETVSRYARLRREGNSNPAISTLGSNPSEFSKPAIASAGSGAPNDSKPAIVTPGSEAWSQPDVALPGSQQSPGRPSQCESLREVIKAKLELGLSAQRIFQDIVIERGFSGSYSAVKRFVRRLGASTPLPFRRMENAFYHFGGVPATLVIDNFKAGIRI